MSEKIEVEFKFKVGDLVMPAAVAHLLDDMIDNEATWMFRDEPEMRFVVQERLYQQCYNAFQIHYTCRAVGRNGYLGKDNISFTEPMIAAAPSFKTKKEIRELRKQADAENLSDDKKPE